MPLPFGGKRPVLPSLKALRSAGVMRDFGSNLPGQVAVVLAN